MLGDSASSFDYYHFTTKLALTHHHLAWSTVTITRRSLDLFFSLRAALVHVSGVRHSKHRTTDVKDEFEFAYRSESPQYGKAH